MKLVLLLAALLSFSSIPARAGQDDVTDSLSTIIVSASRAGSRTPVTSTEVDFRRMDLPSDAVSLPRTLSAQPSVIAVTEGANALGYSSIRIRGVTAYATNVTFNGITLNDAESQEVFWVNIPSLSSIASSAQIQRGLGTSGNGPGAFGASINIATELPPDNVSAETFAASFGTRGVNISAGHNFGDRAPFFQLDYSGAESDGYIRQAPSRAGTIYACGGWKSHGTLIKATFLRGEQHTGITWEGVPEDIFPEDPRFNPCPGASDNFRQSHYLLNASHDFGKVIWSGTLDLTDGRGYYEYPGSGEGTGSDGSRDYTGSLLKVFRSDIIWGNGTSFDCTSGIYLSRYDGGQFQTSAAEGSLTHFYDNEALKTEQNIWNRAHWRKDNLILYGDLHLRAVQYGISGTDWYGAIPEVDKRWLFFSPRAGATLLPKGGGKVYGSIALGHREPARSDILADPASRPEHLTDLEAGYERLWERCSIALTLYAMEYRDMLQETGKLNNAGYAIKANVPRGYRRGMELTVSATPLEQLELEGNLTVSANRSLDVDGKSMGPVVLSPSCTGSFSACILPLATISGPEALKKIKLRSESKYVGEQYWSRDGVIPSYCVTDLSLGTELGAVRFNAFISNIFDLQYYAGAHTGGVYPQSPRTFMLRLGVKL